MAPGRPSAGWPLHPLPPTMRGGGRGGCVECHRHHSTRCPLPHACLDADAMDGGWDGCCCEQYGDICGEGVDGSRHPHPPTTAFQKRSRHGLALDARCFDGNQLHELAWILVDAVPAGCSRGLPNAPACNQGRGALLKCSGLAAPRRAHPGNALQIHIRSPPPCRAYRDGVRGVGTTRFPQPNYARSREGGGTISSAAMTRRASSCLGPRTAQERPPFGYPPSFPACFGHHTSIPVCCESRVVIVEAA